LDNLYPLSSNVIAYQDVPPSGRDVDWGRLFCGSDEEVGANVSSPSESANPCPAVVAPTAGSDSDQTFRCSCCGKHQPAMRFSRDGSLPSEQTRHKVCDRCRSRRRTYHVSLIPNPSLITRQLT
jgi:hypothetical protein